MHVRQPYRSSQRPDHGDEEHGDDAEERQQRQPELPVVAEAVAAGAITIRFAGVATGVRKAAAAATATAISTGFAETSISAAAESAIGITISAVAMLLISWPSTAVSRNEPERAVRAARRRRRRPRAGRRAARRRRSRPSRSRAGSCPPTRITVVQAIAAVRLLDAEHAREHDRAGGEESGNRRRHEHPWRAGRPCRARTRSARFAPGPSGTGLAAHELGLVDDEHIGIVEVLLERAPRALKQERVAGGERRSRRRAPRPCAGRRGRRGRRCP